MKKLILGLGLFAAVGCGKVHTKSMLVSLGDVDNGNKLETPNVPQCVVDNVEYEISTNVLAFELVDKKNIGFGFNLISGFLRAIGLDLKLEKGQMIASMSLSESIAPNQSIADVMAKGESKGTEFRFTLDVYQLGADFGYFKRTPLSKLTAKTLDNGLGGIRNELIRNGNTWKTKVVYGSDNAQEYIVPVGGVAGIKPGDKFAIYNIEYIWKGEPCESELLFERKTSDRPLIVAEAIQVENHATLLRAVEINLDSRVQVGARVEVAQLIGPDANKRELRYPVRIKSVESQPLALSQGQVDIRLYIYEQLRAYMDSYGFYPR